MIDKAKIGDRLRRARMRAGVTGQSVAAAINVTPGAIYHYENGMRTPRDKDKIALARYYGMSVEELFYAEDA